MRNALRRKIIGGGYFGLYLAYYLGSKQHKIDLFEKNSELMARASYNNQARIHNGYHYPRSVLTALRSRESFPRFVKDFPQCVCNDFEKYYMVGKHLSKVTAYQFEKFCKRIGAYLEPAPSKIVNLTNKNYIEACFKAEEYAFDSLKLKNEILNRIDTKIYTSFLLKSKSSGDSCTPTKNGKERYSERCAGEDNIYADYRWDYTKCRYIQISKCPDSSGKYTCFTSSTWKTKTVTTFGAYVDTYSFQWHYTNYWTSMVCGSETAHHSGYVTPQKGQEFDCTPGQYYLYNETYICSNSPGASADSVSKIGWSCLKCAKTDDLSKCIVPENFLGQNCSAGSGSGPLDFKENTDLDRKSVV